MLVRVKLLLKAGARKLSGFRFSAFSAASASAARRRERCLRQMMLRHYRVERRNGLRQILARRGIRRLHRRGGREVTGLECVQLAAERRVYRHERWRWRPAGPEAAEAASTRGITANRRQRGIERL